MKGWGFFSIAMDHPVHRRMAAVIRACSGSRPAGTRSIVLAVLGPRADGLTRKQAYHLCERILKSAIARGYILRIPARGRSGSKVDRPGSVVLPGKTDNAGGFLSFPAQGRPRAFSNPTVYKEDLYVATDEGRLFLDRHENMLRMQEADIERRPLRGGQTRNRKRVSARNERRMRTGLPPGL